MRRAGREWVTRTVGGVLVLALLGCAHTRSAPPSFDPPAEAGATAGALVDEAAEGLKVIAMVERMERAAHTEWFTDGTIIVSNVVGFAVMEPRLSELVFVATTGHPHIGTRPLKLGDLVIFELPPNWQNKDLSLDDLKDLRFRE